MISKKQANKKTQLKILVPDAQHLQHFNNALGITNHIRKQQQLPALGLEKFVLQATIAAANDVLGWYQKQLDEQNKPATEGNNDDKTEGHVDSSTGEDNQPVPSE